MLKIDWTQVKNLKDHLVRQGYTDDTDVAVMIVYRNKTESQQAKIKLGTLEKLLFEICNNSNIVGFYLFDAELKRPLWKIKEETNKNSVEPIPSSGHPSIIRDFKSMSPEQREVWLQMTLASLNQYITNEI